MYRNLSVDIHCGKLNSISSIQTYNASSAYLSISLSSVVGMNFIPFVSVWSFVLLILMMFFVYKKCALMLLTDGFLFGKDIIMNFGAQLNSCVCDKCLQSSIFVLYERCDVLFTVSFVLLFHCLKLCYLFNSFRLDIMLYEVTFLVFYSLSFEF